MFSCDNISWNLPKESFLRKCLVCLTEENYEDTVETTADDMISSKSQNKHNGNVDKSIEITISVHDRPKMIPNTTGVSISTITTKDINDMKHPLSLPNFIPARESFDASDFTAQSFMAKLRSSGMTVIKHNRCVCSKSKYRTLYIHVDKRSLTWRPAPGEPTSRKKRVELLDLSTCIEVRHGTCFICINSMRILNAYHNGFQQ